jgi:hypothetical protein
MASINRASSTGSVQQNFAHLELNGSWPLQVKMSRIFTSAVSCATTSVQKSEQSPTIICNLGECSDVENNWFAEQELALKMIWPVMRNEVAKFGVEAPDYTTFEEIDTFVDNYLYAFKQIRVLKLDGLNLPAFPMLILLCKDLRGLNLAKNKIRSIPSQIGDLRDLEVLLLQNNKIKKIPATISHCSKLNALYLDGNPLNKKGLPIELSSMNAWESILKTLEDGNDGRIIWAVDNLKERVDLEIQADAIASLERFRMAKQEYFRKMAKELWDPSEPESTKEEKEAALEASFNGFRNRSGMSTGDNS